MSESAKPLVAAGTVPGGGIFRCAACDYAVALTKLDEVPECPRCRSKRWYPGSIFSERPEPDQIALGPEPGWLPKVRKARADSAPALIFESDDGTIEEAELHDGWTRIGRSLSAHVRLDDPTVSRRHALVHREGGDVRILDDRSLNGVYVNGTRIDWRELADGDTITLGRFELHFVKPGGDRADTHDDMSGLLALRDVDDAWRQSLGPLLTAADWRDRFGHDGAGGVAVMTQTVSSVGIESDEPDLLYPAFQFDDSGQPYPAALEVVRRFRVTGVSPYATASWFTTAQAALDGATPADWLRDERDPLPLFEAARRTLERLSR